jgi:hypothetical protein
MSLRTETSLGDSDAAEIELAERYALRFPPRGQLSLYRRLRIAVGQTLRNLGLRRTPPPEPWLAGLRHVAESDGARPLVIWAMGVDRDTLRTACRNLRTLVSASRDFAPVLVTDVADFAFFSRTGWLVEYVPVLSAPAESYAERKRRYLAWRYRDAPALPVSALLKEGVRIEDLLLG